MKSRSFFITAVCVSLILSSAGLYAEGDNTDQIMLADIPFFYGEQKFIERIKERAGDRPPVGLVLSGGSARAFAHIGVLRRMEELGIVPDYIVTNSMGSIVGLLYGAGFSPDQISEIIQSTDIGELFKVTLPLSGGIIDVGKFSGLLSSYTGEIDVSELAIPVMVICEDLKTKRQVRIAEGSLTTVMQAAYALPVYFNPVEYKEHLLIDGGVANLVPLSAAYEYSDTVIASTAFYQNPRLNLRNPVTNINVAIDIGKSRTGVEEIKKYKPILIRCDVESFSFMEFGSLAEIQAAGYRSADMMSSRLSELDAGGIDDSLAAVRERNRQKIIKAVNEYRPLESIPVPSPGLLVTAGIGVFPYPRSTRYLNEDLHITGGLDFSWRYFNAVLSAGAGTDLGEPTGFFPVVDAGISLDVIPSLRVKAAGSLRMITNFADYSDWGNPSGAFGSSDLYAELHFVPLASENFRFGLLGAGETATEAGFSLPEFLVTAQLEFSAASNPRSEENYTVALFCGGQILNQDAAFDLENVSVFADLDFELPIPATGGLLRWDNRGFTRYPLTGTARYYLRDGMRSSVKSAEAQNVSFASTEIVLNPYEFRPAFAELFMFKEIEVSAFGELGWIDQIVWSSGLSFSTDLSLIGLKPVNIDSYIAWDGPSNGFIGGIMLVP